MDVTGRQGGAITKPRPEELFRNLATSDIYRRAAQEGMSVSAYLETEYPTSEYKDGLDAYDRLLAIAGIRTASLSTPNMRMYADKLEAFGESEHTRALFPEWVARQWRRVQAMPREERALITSSETPLGGVMRPYYDNAVARFQQLQPAVPLDEVIALTSPIDGDAYRAFYLTDTTDQERMVRVAEGTDLPLAKLAGGEHIVRLKKYGRALMVTYEQIRRQRIDVVAFHIARMAIQAEADKLDTVLDIAINGDGNANTAATSYNMTALDAAAVAGTLTLKAWLAFKMKFLNPYALTTVLVKEATALQMMLLNLGSANVPLVTVQAQSGFGSFRVINPTLRDAVGLGVTPAAPTLKIVGIDTRFAIQRITENGSDISEVERFIRNQTQLLTMSEVEGYAVLDQFATKVMDVNA